MVTIAVRDIADGTGAEVTVADFGAGVTCEVYRRTHQITQIDAAVKVGERVGPGVVTPVAGVGTYSWYAQLVPAGTQSLTITRATSTEGDSVWHRYERAVKLRLDALALPGITAVVSDVELPKINEYTSPFILLYTIDQTEERITDSEPLQRDDIGYPVVVQIVMDKSDDVNAYKARWKMWRHRCERAMHLQAWDLRVPEVWKTEVRFGNVLSLGELEDDRMAYGLLTAVGVARESRGLTV
jgi:hypothetical protein